MSVTKSQSPGPTTTSSQQQQTQRARTKAKETGNTMSAGRPGSAGGVMLDQGQRNSKANMTTTTKQGPPDSSITDPAAKTTTLGGPNRPRRRPRKLNKDPTSSPSQEIAAQPSSTPSKKDTPPHTTSTTTELEALKSRVRGLEAKVEELYKAGHTGRGARSPRRRGKRKSSSNTQAGPSIAAGTTAGTEETGKVVEVFDEDGDDVADRPPAGKDDEREDDEEEEKNEELVRLEGELAVARRDLESYHRQRPRHQQRRRSNRLDSAREDADEEHDFVEDIPRTASPGVQDRRRAPNAGAGDRQVTLTGSYRIPLPATVSMDDVRSIQSGVSAAQNVARSFLEQRRARNAAMEAETGGASLPRRQRQRSSSSALTKERADETGKQSWGEWFGGYSMAISRAVRNIEAEAAVESQPRGSSAGWSKGSSNGLPKKRSGAPGSGWTAGKATKGKAAAGRTGQQRQRPASKTSVGGLSGEAVKGLVS